MSNIIQHDINSRRCKKEELLKKIESIINLNKFDEKHSLMELEAVKNLIIGL